MPLSEVVLIVMALLTIAMLAAAICRNISIPYTVFLVILGVALGGLSRSWPQFEPLLQFQLTPELVLFLFLPALIFESAFNLDARQLIKDLAPVLILAIPALLASTLIIGTGLWLAIPIDYVLALLFGALISATDPVAVIALFKELGAPQRLTILVEGESLLNDATAIVVFNILLGMVVTGSVAWSDLGIAVGDFFRVFLGGVLAGAALGFLISELLYWLRAGLSSYLIMSIVLAYAGFSIAEHILHVSGVMAVVGGAITLGIFGVSRIPQSAVHTVKETWEMIALVCNSLLFLLVGLSVDLGQLLSRSDLILLAMLIILMARAATVYTMVPATVRLFRLPAVSVGEQHIMWWGGLKGGLAIAIVLSIPVNIAGRGLLLDLTLGTVILSLLVNAPSIRPLIRLLGIDRLTNDEKSELKHGLLNARKQAGAILEQLQDAGLVSRGNLRRIEKQCEPAFLEETPELEDRHDVRHLYISALRVELEELKDLYDIGIIQHYIYLDIKNNIQKDRETWLSNPDRHVAETVRPSKPGLFLRVENALLRRMREHDWAAGLLARYQFLRFSQSLQRNIAGVMTARAVLNMLDAITGREPAQLEQVRAVYSKRMQRRKERLQRVAEEFGDFYQRFATRLFTKVALLAADRNAEVAYQHGEIGSKAHARIDRRIKEVLG
ncbi:MAG: sodium:proton antiporter, partial [Gammaproteobacteria bacterium]|nr:sodium:proton antiporter [Gammaproteobacteria bacterium]